MRILLAVIIIAAAAWGTFWFVGARAVEQGADSWFDQQHANGLEASHAGLGVGGFPNRFDLTVNAPRLFSRLEGIGWEAPFLQVFALSYVPNHIIAVWPDQQTLTLPLETIGIQSDDLRASVVFGRSLSLALRRFTLVGDAIWLRSDDGWQVGLDSLRVATRRTGTEPDTHDLALEADGFVPDPRWFETLDGQTALPPRMQQVRLDASIALDAPLDRSIFGRDPAQLTAININDARIVWGDMLIWGDGALTINGTGEPEGRITFRARNWRQMVDVAVAVGLVNPEVSDTWVMALEMLEAQSETGDELEIALRFERGRMSLGPIPLGPAPRLTSG